MSICSVSMWLGWDTFLAIDDKNNDDNNNNNSNDKLSKKKNQPGNGGGKLKWPLRYDWCEGETNTNRVIYTRPVMNTGDRVFFSKSKNEPKMDCERQTKMMLRCLQK